ncbi:MAG: hypothetical protein DI586_06345 [Micavibrio aeruginosavorus]|uniref:Uncharacterized protein n=1 Tax=Micavibrio aeruginosavorus TaxID=349221 RepID=A0A2W5FI63_9BACT|nr:MAG: hypothetical protein DI586_06345 [Micavibrio aeruginosavorus]
MQTSKHGENKMLSPSHILHITHPQVTSAYIKQDLDGKQSGKQVLVLETAIEVGAGEQEDDRYLDLLVDLPEIKQSVEMQFGDISRVDIRSSTFH